MPNLDHYKNDYKKDYNNGYNNNYNNDSYHEGYNMNNSDSSSEDNEDLPLKLPVRLDKNLVKRKSPERKNMNPKNKVHFNLGYNNNQFEDININSRNQIVSNNIEKEGYFPQYNYDYQHHIRCRSDFYNNHNMVNFDKEMENTYNDRLSFQRGKFNNDRFISNNLDLKIYQEDISNELNNGRY